MASSSVIVAEAMLEDQLADIWPDFPCLYDVRCPEFKNRELREKAFQEIAVKLGKTSEWVKAKIRALRNSYVKAKKPPPSGSARKNPSRRTLWLLDKLQFLAPHVATRASISNLDSESTGTPTSELSLVDIENDDDDDDDVNESEDDSVNPSCPASHTQGVSMKSTNEPFQRRSTSRKRQAEEEYNLIKNLSQSIADKHKRKRSEKQSGNLLDAFGNYVSRALSELDSRTCYLAQNKINNIIFQAQAGLLTQEIQPQMMIRPQSSPLERNYFHPIAPNGIGSSPQPTSIYADSNMPIRDEQRLNPASGWQT